MKKVIGIGGIFFKSQNPKELAAWYKKHLGVPIDESFNGYSFQWNEDQQRPTSGYTIWSPFKETTEYMNPSDKDFMFNFIVEDLEALLNALKTDGITPIGEITKTEFGKFSWVVDPENNKVELWEPNRT